MPQIVIEKGTVDEVMKTMLKRQQPERSIVMRGLFEKDIRIIKNQKKMMLIFAGMGVLLLLSGVEISFILPYMASVMTSVAISTISYDSMDNGNSFLFTLPVRRKDYATEKYFFVCGFGAVSALIVAIACGILLLVRKSEMTAGVLGVETMICLLIVLLLADLLVPLQIKFGAEKSKIVILATVGILVLGFEFRKIWISTCRESVAGAEIYGR